MTLRSRLHNIIESLDKGDDLDLESHWQHAMPSNHSLTYHKTLSNKFEGFLNDLTEENFAQLSAGKFKKNNNKYSRDFL